VQQIRHTAQKYTTTPIKTAKNKAEHWSFVYIGPEQYGKVGTPS